MDVCRIGRGVVGLGLVAACLLGHAGMAAESTGPRVWVVGGLAGDAERVERYRATVTRLREALQQGFGIPEGDIRLLFDRGADGIPACDEGALLRELDAIRDASVSGRPLWLILVGHAATGKGEARFHLPGRDITARQLGERLGRAASGSPLVILLTHTASGAFLDALAGPNRVLVAASAPGQEDNETEFPHLLAEVLSRPREADADGNGTLTVTEMARATSARVEAWYRERGLVITERAVVDGNGDGKADPTPGSDDDRYAAAVGLAYRR